MSAIEAEATAPLLAALREISESYDEWSRRPHQADATIPERLWRALVAGAALVPAEPPEAQRCDCRGAGSYYRAEHAFGCPMFASPAEPPATDGGNIPLPDASQQPVKP